MDGVFAGRYNLRLKKQLLSDFGHYVLIVRRQSTQHDAICIRYALCKNVLFDVEVG